MKKVKVFLSNMFQRGEIRKSIVLTSLVMMLTLFVTIIGSDIMPNLVNAATDTTWQNDYTYTLDNTNMIKKMVQSYMEV